MFQAPLLSTTDGPSIAPSAGAQDTESADETSTLNGYLMNCPIGEAVELALGSDPSSNAFLIDPITVPPGVSLIVNGGVTVFASRDPAHYQDKKSNITCGAFGKFDPLKGCIALLTFAAIAASMGMAFSTRKETNPSSPGTTLVKAGGI